ncbi:sigma-70 family RNA polymerase sigma factor [Nocardia cyriacigeorgica]|uniref:Sigma-70 family RNA polymerase sigma factor n=1 Tax=Nocardia cyriacigeorgica TaxID=135487 RepID=A0A6P1D2L6_9NOCA|nr:sigma-70 family RNA polymerase sigma factor [Nocardia cyriacigeorgica]NEW42200.1 sigma-70 family RNA polymerase sigma factor [Nocardia cyriacigeorgica]NEW44238.1 sigma-70 family RNA polymerase sigma factor [Nocardia cyriacigeorgica]NEW51264.1 sigma-70 family RNA polymerase sigma factor [Nocardia cyriacigeorgica]NEW56969.1 sigma-70 family RNA polymerase sigma factor [Nocardia cyriacigeorgica]
MDYTEWLIKEFEANRTHLHAVAYRMLGSVTDAEDAVQEAWIRLSRTDVSDVDNLAGWLTTVVSRVSLNELQRRKNRREQLCGTEVVDDRADRATTISPEQETMMADSVGSALLVVLDTLSPAERLAFVLHDMFAVPFDEIAAIVGRSSTATRQLASRARRRVHGIDQPAAIDIAQRSQIVDAFLRAARTGRFDTLLELLDPDVVVRADDTVVAAGAAAEVIGAEAVARTFTGRAQGVRPALVDREPGAIWMVGGRPRIVFTFTILDAKIVGIEMISDPEKIVGMDLSDR